MSIHYKHVRCNHVLLYLPLNFKTIPQLSGDKARHWQHCIAMGDTCISNEILISAKCKKIFFFNKNSSKKGKKSKNIVKSWSNLYLFSFFRFIYVMYLHSFSVWSFYHLCHPLYGWMNQRCQYITCNRILLFIMQFLNVSGIQAWLEIKCILW